MGTRGPTVRDIADELNVSPSTVSRGLNGSPLVGEDTKARIEEAAADMGYRRRRIRRHAPRSILVVALFLPRSREVHHRLFYDPAELLAGITEGFGDLRIQISVSVNQPKPELLNSKKSGSIDACIFGFTTPGNTVETLLRKRGVPTVLLNRESPQGNFVSTDHSAGMRGLLKRAGGEAGGFAPCFISFNPARPVALLREEAFLGACGEMGIPASEADIIRIDSIDRIDPRLIRDIARRKDALFCFNDFVAVYAYQTALLAGLSIPEDLALAGYDDSPIRRLTPQKIDTVSLSPYRLGFEAAVWLRSVIIDRSEDPLRRLIPGGLVPGETLRRKSRRR